MAFNLAEDGSYGGAVLRRVAGAGCSEVSEEQGRSNSHRHCEERSDEAIQTFLRRTMDCFAALAMTGAPSLIRSQSTNTTSRSRGLICPRLAIEFPCPPVGGCRECRAHAAPAVSCAIGAKKYAHEHTGSAEASDIPCAMALRLISRSPRRAGLVVTVISGIASTNLTPASGRQDHATLPYASVPHVKGTSASTASHPALVTIAKRPSYRDGTQSIYR